MLIDDVRNNLMEISRHVCGKAVPLSIEVSFLETSDWVTPAIQRIAAQKGESVQLIESAIRQKATIPNGIAMKVAKDGLIHLTANNETLMACCRYYEIESTKKFQGTAIMMNVPDTQNTRSDHDRARRWAKLYGALAKEMGVSVAKMEEGKKPQITIRSDAVESRHLFQTLSMPQFKEKLPKQFSEALINFYAGLERTGKPVSVRQKEFISLKNPLFKIFYAEHLIASFNQQVKDLKIVRKTEDANVFNVNEARQIAKILLIWPMLKEHAYRDGELRALFLHAISLSDWVIKWYNTECLWNEREPELVKGRKFVLDAAAVLLRDVLDWVDCPYAETW